MLIQVPEKRVLVSDWDGWDKLVFGGYVPVDATDSAAFGKALADRFGPDIPPPRNAQQPADTGGPQAVTIPHLCCALVADLPPVVYRRQGGPA